MRKLLSAFIVLALCAIVSAQVAAQNTWNQTAFSNRATSGRSSIFRNINQSSHWLTYCAGSSTTGGTIELDGSADAVHWITISNLGVLQPGQCGAIQGGGYYPNVSAFIANLAGPGPSVTATYSASTAAIPTPSNAGYSTTDQPVTYVPIDNVGFTSTLKSAAVQLTNGTSNVVYYLTMFNPNASTVYVAVGGGTSLFVLGASVFMVPVPAGQAVNVSLPSQGIVFFGGTGLYVGCSTSPTSAADPTSACFVTAAWKSVSTGLVPN